MASYTYDVYGNILTFSGTLASINPFRYRGYYYDTETGFYYLNARYYDPSIYRFVNADSTDYIGPNDTNGFNLYAYCYNDPINYTDPNGCLAAVCLCVVYAAIIGGVLGAVYGGLTAYVNNQNVGLGILLGAGVGDLIGAGSAVAAIYLSPLLTGGALIGTLNLTNSTLIGIGFAFCTGAIGGAYSETISQIINYGEVNSVSSVLISSLEWATINTIGAFSGALFPTEVIECIVSSFSTGLLLDGIGMSIDVLRSKL